mmetsp:Transcript_16070/g.27124  ORF Transcript_16070/g.27124 Transcript_16070/m.27124 type:complete len:231 (-) Transcript_16070:225-917(-)
MLDVLDLAEDDGLQLLLRGAGHFVAGLLKQLLPQLHFLVLLLAELGVDFGGDLLGLDVTVSRDAVHLSLLAVVLLDDVVGDARGLVQQEGPLDLVLPLLVPGRRRLVGHIPPVIVNVSGVAAGVSGLGLSAAEGLVEEALANHELLVVVVEVLEGAAHLLLMAGLGPGEVDALVPLLGLGAEQVLVDLLLNHLLQDLGAGLHVLFLAEELVLGGEVDLAVLDAADGPPHL